MSDAANVRRRDNWVGEAYQLALWYGGLTEAELSAARAQLETAGGLRRPKHGGHRGYVVRLPTGKRVVCRIHSGWNDPENAYLWLDISLEALRLVDRRVGAFIVKDDDGLSWRPVLDDWLANLARQVYAVVPFRAGLIGCEVSGVGPHTGPVPTRRYHGMLVVCHGELRYLPVSIQNEPAEAQEGIDQR